MNKIINGDSLEVLKKGTSDTIDCIVTDPPYGYSFMGKDWDKAVPSVELWKECLRVLKPGGFAFVMSAPRQDVLSQMIVRLGEAGFNTSFTSLYWTYASGFPKAMNIGKMVDKRNGTTPDESRAFAEHIKARRLEKGITLTEMDKEVCGGTTNYSWFEGRPAGQRLPRENEYQVIKQKLELDSTWDCFIGEAEREVIGKYKSDMGGLGGERIGEKGGDITIHSTTEAKALDGSYGGFQPKPAVEVIIVAMKPLSEKTYVDQALQNGKGITWLDDCRIPTSEVIKFTHTDKTSRSSGIQGNVSAAREGEEWVNTQGRFPANLLVSDDVLNDGRIIKGTGAFPKKHGASGFVTPEEREKRISLNDSGSYSRYFDLDKWADTLPFLITPKASKSEKNKGLEDRTPETVSDGREKTADNAFQRGASERLNIHPTVKPLKLMSYLITLGSREGDIVLDPFVGSGTTCLAAKNLNRKYIGIEREAEYAKIAEARLL